MSDVLKSAVVAGVVSIVLSGASYAFLAPHADIVQSFVQSFVPRTTTQVTATVILPIIPQALFLFTALIIGMFGFVVSFVAAGGYFSSDRSETQRHVSGAKMKYRHN